MATILVTGSRGTIGKPLVAELMKRGHIVYGCDVQHSSDENYYRADVGDYRELRRVIGTVRPGFVYHLAGEFGRHNGEDYYTRVWHTNAVGTHNVLELQREFDFNHIFASSSEIYGELSVPGGYLQEVHSDKYPLRQHNDYAISKWVNEQQILNSEERYGTRTMRLRFFNAYGPGEYYHPYRSVVCLFAYKALHGLPITVYKGYSRVFMHIDDFIPTLANAVDYFSPGDVINVGGRERRSVEELIQIILDETNGTSGKITYLEQDEHNVVSKAPHLFRAVNTLGHDPQITLEEGIPSTISWLREVYGVPAQV